MGLQTHLASASKQTLNHFSPGLRLQIEYALIASLLIVCGASVHFWQAERHQRIQSRFLNEQIASLNATIASQEESISFLNTAIGGTCKRITGAIPPPPMLPKHKIRL